MWDAQEVGRASPAAQARRRRRRVENRLPFDLIFHAETLAFDDHGLGVMQQAIQDGGREGTIIIKDLGPFLEGAVRGDHDRALLIAQRDDLEEQISARLVNGQVAELVEDEQRRLGVFLEFHFETPRILGRCQRVDDINGTGKEHRVALEAGRIAQRDGQMRFAVLMIMPSWGRDCADDARSTGLRAMTSWPLEEYHKGMDCGKPWMT